MGGGIGLRSGSCPGSGGLDLGIFFLLGEDWKLEEKGDFGFWDLNSGVFLNWRIWVLDLGQACVLAVFGLEELGFDQGRNLKVGFWTRLVS